MPGGVLDEAQLIVYDVQLHQHRRAADDGDVELTERLQRLAV